MEIKQQLEKVVKCPECGCEDLELKEEEIFCRKCGLVIFE